MLCQKQAEELCSLVDQCFQTLYTEATMKFFDHNVMEGDRAFNAVMPASVDYSYTGVYCARGRYVFVSVCFVCTIMQNVCKFLWKFWNGLL